MKKQFLFLCILLTLRGRSFAQQNIKPSLSITISTTLDTFDWEEYNKIQREKVQFNEADQPCKIIIRNDGKSDIRLPKSLSVSFEEDSFETRDTNYFFRIFYKDGDNWVPSYGDSRAHIDFIASPEGSMKYETLKPGERMIFFDDPFGLNGLKNGIHELQVQFYLRIFSFSGESVIYPSNRISIVGVNH